MKGGAFKHHGGLLEYAGALRADASRSSRCRCRRTYASLGKSHRPDGSYKYLIK
jgi:hypothetical protein